MIPAGEPVVSATWPADHVERWSLDRLMPYASNARTHSESQVAQLAASMKEWGWTNPILVDEDGTIIAGHGRVMAARQLGFTEAPVMIARGWTEAQKRAYVIADNKLAMNAEWDSEVLAVELDELRDLGFPLPLIGFETAELNELIGTPNVPPLDGMPAMSDGDRAPFRQVTFTLHDEQHATLERALAAAKALGHFDDSPNDNGNGNALARVCEIFLTQNGDG